VRLHRLPERVRQLGPAGLAVEVLRHRPAHPEAQAIEVLPHTTGGVLRDGKVGRGLGKWDEK
jgi:hypothetical protein